MGGVTQDELHHELGGRIGGTGVQCGLLGHLEFFVSGIDRGRGGEQDAVHAVALHALEQGDGLADVVVVVGQRLINRLRDDDLSRAVHDSVDLVLGEDAVEQVLVSDVALVEGAVADKLAASRGQVVQDDDLVACLLACRTDRRSDVTGPAGDENLHGNLPCRRDRQSQV